MSRFLSWCAREIDTPRFRLVAGDSAAVAGLPGRWRMNPQNICVILRWDPKPVPSRAFDWTAEDDNSEGTRIGHGATAADALRDLAEVLESAGVGE